MKEIKVFIASANDELEERLAIKGLIQNMNEVTSSFGVEINPLMWELVSVEFRDGLKPKQDEYNDMLINSDIAFFIFGKRVGNYTAEEFKKACEQVKNNTDIKVFTYFKDVSLGSTASTNASDLENAGGVLALKKHISVTLKQVYGEFRVISELLSVIEKEILKLCLPIIVEQSSVEPNIQEFIKFYRETNKPFQIDNRDQIVSDAINSLFFLWKYNYMPKLDKDSFYGLCHRIISTARKDSSIKALSCMLKFEWNDTEDEKKFWEDNQEAVRRYVDLERIFIVNKEEAHRLKSIPQIKKHMILEERSEHIHSYVIEKEFLQEYYPTLFEQARNGFIMIKSQQDNIALLDENPEFGQRAKPVLKEEDLEELLNTFKNIKNLSIPLKDYLNQIHWSHHKKEMISIFVTTKCNLNCDYCFTNKNQNNHKNQTISLEFVKKGIDDYFKDNYMRHVRFFGAGEPTCEFELLKKIHQYARTVGGEAVTFEIQTNGAFSDRIAFWLRDNIDIIWISCDGTPDIQDKHRPFYNDSRKTSDVIRKNIKILQNSRGKSFVGIRATITNENITRQKEMIDYFSELGIQNIWVDPIFPSVGETACESNSDFDMMLFAKEFLEATRYAYSKKIFYGSILTCNFNDSVNKHCRACLPVPHLTTDGYVSACDMALFGKDKNHMSQLIYGEWDETSGEIIYDQNKKRYIQNRTTENLPHCEMCPAKEHCGGYCLGEVLNETGDIYGQKKSVCPAICYLNNNLEAEIRKYNYTHP